LGRYIIRRILWFIPVLLTITLATFIFVRAIPGGPFDFIGDRSMPEATRKALERKYHLDEPMWKQYVRYLWDLGHGDFGLSLHYKNRTVNDIVRESLPVSAQLGALAMLVALGIGIPAGIFAALRQNTLVDYSSTFIAIVGVSVPEMVLGPLLIWTFALKLGWLPVARWGSLRQAVMPTLALGVGLSASIARLTRASLLQVIREDYIRTARAKGLPEQLVVVRHALKNALIPVVTILGPMFAAVITGTFVVEQIFGIPGMGKHFVQSINNRDYPLVVGVTLVYSVFLVVANLLVDITYAWLDPRIRFE